MTSHLAGDWAERPGALDPRRWMSAPSAMLLTVVLGVATGVLSGLFGVGGGVISQPGMRLLGLGPLAVIGTALPVIIPGAASGARAVCARGPHPLARRRGNGARRTGGGGRRAASPPSTCRATATCCS